MKTEDLTLDGNAIGGVLQELFGAEMTMAVGVCGSCGTSGYVASIKVYMHAPGIVGRCSHCDAVMLRIVRSETRTWLDLSGTRSIELSSTT
jgi:hypothetical protein